MIKRAVRGQRQETGGVVAIATFPRGHDVVRGLARSNDAIMAIATFA